MPLTKSGKKVLASMKKQYGERGEEVFYRSENKGVPGSEKWTKKHKSKKGKTARRKKNYSKEAIAKARENV